MSTFTTRLSDDEVLSLLRATGRVKRLPRNHSRNLLSAERKLLAMLTEEQRKAYQVSLSLSEGEQDNETRS